MESHRYGKRGHGPRGQPRRRAVVEVRSHLRLRLRGLHVDRHRLYRGEPVARQELLLRRARHLRLQKGRLLLLPEPVDFHAHAAPVPALELEGQRGANCGRDVLHQLRERGALPEWQVIRRERLRFPAPGSGARSQCGGRSAKRRAHDIRSAPELGCAVRAGDIESRGNSRRQRGCHGRGIHHRRSSGDRPLSRPGRNRRRPPRRGPSHGSHCG